MPKRKQPKATETPGWSVQVYPSTISAGYYAHLFTPSGKVATWRDSFSRRGALLSLLTYADERLCGVDREQAMAAVRVAIETGAGKAAKASTAPDTKDALNNAPLHLMTAGQSQAKGAVVVLVS